MPDSPAVVRGATARAGVDILPAPLHSRTPKTTPVQASEQTQHTMARPESKPSKTAYAVSADEASAQKETKKLSSAHKKRHRRLALAFYGLAIVTVLGGGFLAYQAYSANRAVEKQVETLTQQEASSGSSSSLPSDTKPKDPNYVQNYKVGPLVPRLLTIKKLGMTSRVMPVGTDKEGRMDVPKTAYDVGWYTASARPGEMGAMVIDGHVQGVGGPAVFTKLHTLVAGDTIQVERGDGKKIDYKVVSVETVPANTVDMAKLLVSSNTAAPGLNLITCGGTYSAEKGTFTDRTVVYTLQM